MDTPNLDALIAQAAQEPQNFNELLAVCKLKHKRDELFGTHGPAMVTALKRILQSTGWRDAMNRGDMTLCTDIVALLTKIDQEAGKS